MPAKPRTSRKGRIGRWIVLVALTAVLLENIPGTYVIDDAQDEFELDSWEGVGLLAVASASVEAELFFDRPTRHRISRNAEILVPADTRLTFQASMIPTVEEGEAVARPHDGDILSDRPLTFIYRGVTVARANRLRMREVDGEQKLQAVGRYRVLSALLTAHRYHRQKKVRRDYQAPHTAKVDFTAEFHPDHTLEFGEGLTLRTGASPGTLRVRNAHFDQGEWVAGTLDLDLRFGDPEALVNRLMKDLLPKRFDLGGAFAVELKKIHHIVFTENHLDLHLDGRLTSANSSRLENLFHPGFRAHLGIAFDLPENSLLTDSHIGIELKNIHSLDFNRSNPLLDKSLRSLARAHRKEAATEFRFAEEIKELHDLPVRIFVHHSRITGTEDGGPILQMKLGVLPREEATPQ